MAEIFLRNLVEYELQTSKNPVLRWKFLQTHVVFYL